MKQKIDEERVLQLHSQGMTQQKIADELGTSKGGINNILKKHNLTESLRSKMIDVEQVLKLHSEGYSNPDIAKIVGHARSKIYDIVSENGFVGNVNKKDYSEFKIYNPTKEQLIEDLKINTIEQIAKINNTSSVSVLKRMKEHGVVSPRNK